MQTNEPSPSAEASAPHTELSAVRQFTARNGALLIAGLALLVYLPALDGQFILDDDLYVTNSRFISAPDGLLRFWITTQAMEYYPVTNSSLWLEWRLWGTNPTGYHITNLLLHIASAFLIWAVLRKLAIPGAYLAALLFTVHPVNVESVAWISQRKDLLAIDFSLLSALWYLEADEPAAAANNRADVSPRPQVIPGRETWYWLSWLAFLLAMLSKGSVAYLPLVLLGLAWWRRRQITLADVTTTLPFFFVAIILSGLNVWCQTSGFIISIRSVSVAQRIVGAAAAVWFYLAKALLPIDLVFIYPQWIIVARHPLWLLPLLAAVVVTIALWRQRISPTASWGRSLLLAWGFFCAALLPVLGLADVGFMRYSLVADHYQHAALIAVCALVAAGFNYWSSTVKSAARMALPLAAILIGVLGVLTWQQSQLYIGPITLYSTLLDKNPACSLAHFNLGNELVKNNRAQEAIPHYEMALQLDPQYSDAQANLGAALVSLGRPEEAISHYQEALKLKPDNFDAMANMALAYAALKCPSEAIDAAEKAAQMARSHDETALANRIEAWLTQYRAQQANVPAASHAEQPSP